MGTATMADAPHHAGAPTPVDDMNTGVLCAETEPADEHAPSAQFEHDRWSSPISLTWRDELGRTLRSLCWTNYHRRLAAQPLFAACSRSEIRTIARWGDEIAVDADRPLLHENTIGYCF